MKYTFWLHAETGPDITVWPPTFIDIVADTVIEAYNTLAQDLKDRLAFVTTPFNDYGDDAPVYSKYYFDSERLTLNNTEYPF
jgi:hypothetical protein